MADQDKTLTRAQRWAAVGVAIASSCLFGYGVAGSYRSIEGLAVVHQIPLPALVPVGIDGGLVGAVVLDIVLTWTGYPVWWLRWVSRSLTFPQFIGCMARLSGTATSSLPFPLGRGSCRFKTPDGCRMPPGPR